MNKNQVRRNSYSHNQYAIKSALKTAKVDVSPPKGGKFVVTKRFILNRLIESSNGKNLDELKSYLNNYGLYGFAKVSVDNATYLGTVCYDLNLYKKHRAKGIYCISKMLVPTYFNLSRIITNTTPNNISKYTEGEENQLVKYLHDSATVISAEDLFKIAKQTLPNLNHSSFNLDRKFWVWDEEAFEVAKNYDKTDEEVYVPERYDCDNFAFDFKSALSRLGATAFGVVLDSSSSHAYNATILRSDEVNTFTCKIYEPQTDKFVKVGSSQFKAEKGVVIW